MKCNAILQYARAKGNGGRGGESADYNTCLQAGEGAQEALPQAFVSCTITESYPQSNTAQSDVLAGLIRDKTMRPVC